MSNASAKYILSAEDKTKGAVASVKRGFEDLDKGAKRLMKGLKAFGVGAVAVKALASASRLANEGIKNLAASNAEFAAQVKVGEAAMRSALTAGEDTIKAQERLNAALTDPQMQAATRNLTDNLGAFFTGVKATAIEAFGWLTKLETKIGLTRRDFAGEYAAAVQMARAGIEMPTVDKDPDKYMKLVRAATKRDAEEAAKDAAQALADAQKANADFAEGMRDAMDDAYRDLERGYDEEAKRHLEYFIEPVIANLDLIPEATKAISDEMSVYADQAARNMQDAFADFLFDPFDKGLKGMLKGFIDVVRRMIAEQAAAKIFGSKSSGGFGLGDALSTGVKSLLGFANGGSFNVGGSGGTDSQVVAFRATPGERVSVQTPGQVGMGGLTVAPVYHIDARGASMDVMKTLPVALRQTSDMTVERVRDLIRRGKL